jgi:TetR/AcrR family transcriptional regulator, transcriptional repressor for nem operon
MTTPPATADAILDAAERMTQALGYNGVSFRDLAAAVGIKSASVHYHFPTKGALAAAVARRYTDRLVSLLETIDVRSRDPKQALAPYVAIFRSTLEQDGRMCLCGMLAAETDAIPQEVQVEVQRFVKLNVQWISSAIARASGAAATSVRVREHAMAVFAALEGAMLVARATGQISTFDAIAAKALNLAILPR